MDFDENYLDFKYNIGIDILHFHIVTNYTYLFGFWWKLFWF